LKLQVFGNCPLLDKNWSSSDFNLTHALHYFAVLTGWMPLFTLDIYPMSETTVMLKLEPGNLTNIDYSNFVDAKGNERQGIRDAMEKFMAEQIEFVFKGKM
jgi:hypothetical protein